MTLLLTHPDDVNVFELGLSMVQHQQYLDASDRFKRIIQRQPDALPDVLITLYKRLMIHDGDSQLQLLIADLLIDSGQYENAFDELADLVDVAPDFTQSYFLLSKLYKFSAQKDEIVRIFETAFEAGVMDSAILDLLPTVYMDQGDYVKGVRFYERFIEWNDDISIAHYQALSEFYLKAKQYDKLVETYLKISDLSPQSVESLVKKCEHVFSLCPGYVSVERAMFLLYSKAYNPGKAAFIIKDMVLGHRLELEDGLSEFKTLQRTFVDNNDVDLAYSDVLIFSQRYSEAVSVLKTLFQRGHDADDISGLIEKILAEVPGHLTAIQLRMTMRLKAEFFSLCIDDLKRLLDMELDEFNDVQSAISMLIAKGGDTLLDAQLLEGEFALKRAAYSECQSLATALLNGPGDLAARLILSRLEVAQGHFTRAHGILMEALKRFSYAPSIHKALKQFQHDRADDGIALAKEEASAHYITLPAKHYLSAGLWQLIKGDLLSAIEAFQKIGADTPNSATAQLLIARCFLEMGRYDLSLSQLKRLHRDASDVSPHFMNQVRFFMSVNYSLTGQVGQALRSLEEILEYDIHYPNIHGMIKEKKRLSLMDIRGQVLSAALTSGLADDPLQLVSVSNPENSASKVATMNEGAMSFGLEHNNQGVEYMLNEQDQSAMESFDLALQMDPHLTAALCNKAILSVKTGDLESALSSLERAESLNPKMEAVFLNRGLIYIKQGEIDLAYAQFETVLSLSPGHALATLTLGDLSIMRDQYQTAFSHWDKLLSMGEFFHFIHRRLWYLSNDPSVASDWIDDSALSFLPILNSRPNLSAAPMAFTEHPMLFSDLG